MMCGILCLYNQQRNVLDDCGKFNKNLHQWNLKSIQDKNNIFKDSVLEQESNLPYWANLSSEEIKKESSTQN